MSFEFQVLSFLIQSHIKRTHNSLFVYAVAFAAGCGIATYGGLREGSGVWLLAGAVVLCLLCAAGFVWIRDKKADALRRVVILTAAVALGMAAYDIRNPQREASHYTHHVKEGERYRIVAEITSEPKRTAKRLKATAEVKAVATGDSMRQTTGKTVIYFDTLATQVSAGMRVAAIGEFRLMNQTIGTEGFQYRKYMMRKGVTSDCFAHTIETIPLEHTFTLQIRQLQKKLSKIITFSKLSPEKQGIAKAILLGDRQAPLEITKEEFRAAGLSHLLCVSGLHVGIIALIVTIIFRPLGRKRLMRIVAGVVQLATVWLFVVITGMAPSTLRAGVMFSFLIVGKVLVENSRGLNILGLSAIALLFYRPTMIADIGFQLSYTAVVGIMVFYRPTYNLVPIEKLYNIKFRSPTSPDSHRRWSKVVAHASTACRWTMVEVVKLILMSIVLSTVAQVCIMPLLLYYFHQLTPLFLIANVLIVPFAGLLLGSILVMMAVSGWEWAWEIMQGLVDWELGIICVVTHWVSGLPGALVEDVRFTLPMLAVAMAALVAVALWVERRKIG